VTQRCVQTGCGAARVPGAFYCAAHGGVAARLGDDRYLELLDQAHHGGHITDRERRQRRLLHLSIRGAATAHAAPGGDGYLWQLTCEYAAGRITVAQGEELLREHDQAVADREAAILADCQALVDAGEARWLADVEAP
jgi:hypothetical protein